jgi:DNA-binding MarR family transcriptional regulator
MEKFVSELDNLLRNTAYLMNLLTRDFAKGQGLSVSRFLVLIYVSRNPGLSMRELQTKMYLAPSSTSALVDNLVEHNLLQRSIDPEDRRVVRLKMTARGEEIMDSILRFRYQKLQQALAGLKKEERDNLISAMGLLADFLKTEVQRQDKFCEKETE